MLGALCGNCSRQAQTCSSTCTWGGASCTPQPGCVPPSAPADLLSRSCYCINCKLGDLPSLDRAHCAYVRWGVFPWATRLNRAFFDNEVRPFTQGALARGMVTEFGIPELLEIAGPACPADNLYRVTVDPAAVPAWNAILVAHRPAATIAPFPTGVSELTFNVQSSWSPIRHSWLLAPCSGVPSLQTDEGWRYHLFAALAAIDAGAGSLFLTQLNLRGSQSPPDPARVLAFIQATRAYFAQRNPGRTLIFGSEGLTVGADVLAPHLNFVKGLVDLDVSMPGESWPRMTDSDGQPYACYAPGLVSAGPTTGADPTGSSCTDTAFRTGPLCVGDSDRGSVRPAFYAQGAPGVWARVNANPRTEHEVPIPWLLEFDGFQECKYLNPTRYVPSVNDGVLAVFYEPNFCGAWDQTTCVPTVRNGLSNTMRFLSQPASVRRDFMRYIAQSMRLWSRETGAPVWFPQLLRVDQNLAIVAQSTANLPNATPMELAQSNLIRYCPDDLGQSTPLSQPFSYQYVAAECGDLDAIAAALDEAPQALSVAASAFARHTIAVLEQRTPSSAEVTPLGTRIMNATDVEAEALAVFRERAALTTVVLPSLTEDEFTRRVFLGALGRLPSAPELTAYGGLARPARVDALLERYETKRSLKRQGLRTAPLNQGRFVFGLYEWLLARSVPETDESDIVFWNEELLMGRRSPSTVVNDFLNSAEFTNRWTGVCAAAPADCHGWYVHSLYWGLLHRAPDAPGLTHWENQLTTGTMTRAQVANAFLGSPEFATRMQRLGL